METGKNKYMIHQKKMELFKEYTAFSHHMDIFNTHTYSNVCYLPHKYTISNDV